MKFTAVDSVRWTTLRGATLSFGWRDPFLWNGFEQPLSGFDHYETPYAVSAYPSRQLDIRYGEDILRLNFENTPNSDAQ
jgi:hypothetical protein